MCSKLEDAISRGMDNLGRVYQKMGRFDTAARMYVALIVSAPIHQSVTALLQYVLALVPACSWQEKLQLSKTTTESCWLSHEIGRCFLELKKYEQAHDYAEKAVQAAEETGDPLWQMNTNALLAQIELASEARALTHSHSPTA